MHLDKATDDQMDKFIVGWQGYSKQIERMDPKRGQQGVRQVLKNQEFDDLFKDKFNEEQFQTLNDFKTLIYESEKKKSEKK